MQPTTSFKAKRMHFHQKFYSHHTLLRVVQSKIFTTVMSKGWRQSY